jgi:quinol monooxygenase YgiN
MIWTISGKEAANAQRSTPLSGAQRFNERGEGAGERGTLDGSGSEGYGPNMSSLSNNFVSLHPYFKVHPGKIEAFKAALPAFMEKTGTEKKNLFYGFSINGDEVFCREGYVDAEGVLAHLDNVGALLAEALKISDLSRVEIHGPAAELEKLKGPLAHLKPALFVVES